MRDVLNCRGVLARSDRILSLGLEFDAARYAWWRGALAGILAGGTFALTLAAVLPRSSAVPQISPAPVESVTNETPYSAPALEGIAKKEVLVLPPVYDPAEPLPSEPIAPSSVEQSSVVEQSSADDSPQDLDNCVGCSNPISYGDAGAAPLSSDAQAQAPDAAQPAEVEPPVVIEQPPPVYFAYGAPAPFLFPPGSPDNAPPPGRLGMINPGFLGMIHPPAFGGMPPHR